MQIIEIELKELECKYMGSKIGKFSRRKPKMQRLNRMKMSFSYDNKMLTLDMRIAISTN